MMGSNSQDDLISRQMAMNAFAERIKRSNNSDFAPVPTWNDAVEIVENLPSVQPEQRWIPVFGHVERGKDMEDIKEEWFYRPIPPFEDFFEEIEKALGFKLFIWQKTFIIKGQFRQYGETTAKIIKRLTVDSIPIDLTQRPRTLREKIENEDLVKIYKKLQAAGVPTCPVFLTKKDKENYRNGTGKSD